jgi:hypothetical protein
MPLERLTIFSPSTVIRSAEVNAEFDQIINILNGTTTDDVVAIGNVDDETLSPGHKLYVEGQSIFVLNGSGAVVRIYKKGSTDPAIDLLNSGEIRTLAGNQAAAPTTQLMIVGGCLGYSSSNVGNVGVGVDTLKTLTIQPNVFGNSGNRGIIKVLARGYTAANANNKQIKFFVNAVEVIASGVVAFNNVPWFLDLEIGLDTDGVGTLTVCGIFKCNATEVRVNTQVTGIDFTLANTISITGEAVADNDIVCNLIEITKNAGTSF